MYIYSVGIHVHNACTRAAPEGTRQSKIACSTSRFGIIQYYFDKLKIKNAQKKIPGAK